MIFSGCCQQPGCPPQRVSDPTTSRKDSSIPEGMHWKAAAGQGPGCNCQDQGSQTPFQAAIGSRCDLQPILASARGPARDTSGMSGVVSALAKISHPSPLRAPLSASGPIRINPVTHTRTHRVTAHPSPTSTSLLSTKPQPNSWRSQPPYPSAPIPCSQHLSDHQPRSFQKSLLNLLSILHTSGGARVGLFAHCTQGRP